MANGTLKYLNDQKVVEHYDIAGYYNFHNKLIVVKHIESGCSTQNQLKKIIQMIKVFQTVLLLSSSLQSVFGYVIQIHSY